MMNNTRLDSEPTPPTGEGNTCITDHTTAPKVNGGNTVPTPLPNETPGEATSASKILHIRIQPHLQLVLLANNNTQAQGILR